jgi:hypothetical protein
MRRRGVSGIAVAFVAAWLGTTNASAATIVERDSAGRPITFRVEAPGVDVGWYADHLRRAPHGDEISRVTVRIVPLSRIEAVCGWGAAGCYFGGRAPVVTVPAGRSRLVATVLLHEYGHHLDEAWPVDGVSEPNGTPVWWALRGISQRRKLGSVRANYSRGWSHGIGEIFAEDYAYTHLGRGYGIPWLYPPSPQLRRVLLAELQGRKVATPPPVPTDQAIRPVVVDAAGTLSPRGVHTQTFRLLGPGRRLTMTASVSGEAGGRVAISCNGNLVKARRVPAFRTVTIAARNVGPGSCRVELFNSSASSQQYSLWIKLRLDS